MDVQQGIGRLTLSERRVLRLIAESMTTREIAQLLALSERTVENRRCGIAQKLNLGGTRGLALFALEHKSAL